MLLDALIFMILGMSTVFVFLVTMVLIMYLSHYLLDIYGKYFPEKVVKSKRVTSSVDRKDEIALAIAVARVCRLKG